MHPFSSPWKHQKTLRFSVFRVQKKGALETNGLKVTLNFQAVTCFTDECQLKGAFIMELSVKKLHGWKPLTFFAKSLIINNDWVLNTPLQLINYQVSRVPDRFEIIIAIFSCVYSIYFAYLLKIACYSFFFIYFICNRIYCLMAYEKRLLHEVYYFLTWFTFD